MFRPWRERDNFQKVRERLDDEIMNKKEKFKITNVKFGLLFYELLFEIFTFNVERSFQIKAK